MDVFRSLITPGCLVRTPSNGHGAIIEFDARLNIVTVRSDGLEADYHFTKLRAGNDETEQTIMGEITDTFPKVGSSIDEQRVLATPDYRRGTIG